MPPASESLYRTGLFLALLASVAIEWARWEYQLLPPIAAAGSMLAAGLLLWSWWGGEAWMSRRSPTFVIAAAVVFVLLPFGEEWLLRTWLEHPSAPEIVQLLLLRNLMIALAAYRGWRVGLHCSFVLGLCAAIAALAMTQHWLGYLLFGLYGLVACWWLMALSWERTEGRVEPALRRELPRSLWAGVLAVLVVLGVGAWCVSDGDTIRSSNGWWYGSGGEGAYDPAAREGVGDGDALAIGREDADTFGPVESEIFLPSDMPTLYDVFNELAGEPFAPKKTELAVGLNPQQQRIQERERAMAEKSGREFSTIRRRLQRPESGGRPPPRDLPSAALLYLSGPTPAHLRLATFDDFDGAIWRHSGHADPAPPLRFVREQQRPWLEVNETHGSLGVRQVAHQLKIVNLDTTRIPAPQGLQAIHIDRIDRLDFFARTVDGLVEMPGRKQIPRLQVIHVRSEIAEEPTLTPAASATRPGDPVLRRLAREWTRDLPVGWPQVEAIVARLRRRCRLEPSAEASADAENTVREFLERGAGPSYQFASCAAVLLRELGYRTRLATGLYASPEAYDAKARQTAVRGEHVHVWAEICWDGRHWETVEATPGFERYRPPQAWWRMVWSQCQRLGAAASAYPGTVLGGVLLLAAILRWRQTLLDRALTGIWQVIFALRPAWRAESTLWLLEFRSWLAGRVRPAHEPPVRWLRQGLDLREPAERTLWDRFEHALRQALYGPPAAGTSPSHNLLGEAGGNWTWRDFLPKAAA